MVRVAVALLMVLLVPSAAYAEKRIALLIGNQAYANEIGPLANPHNDVALLEKTLKALNFEVAVERDASLGALTRAVNAYARRLRAAGPDAIGFFYYSGHGAADGTINYLIPVDAKSAEDSELWDQSLRLTEITRKLKGEAGNATHFVVFDACRNVLKIKQAGSKAVVQSKGFVPVSQESGMLIAYATAEGELASDLGAGAGPYAKVLAEEIVKPGVEAVYMFRNVQRRVRAAIKQEPYLGFNALGDVYLAGVSQPPSQASGGARSGDPRKDCQNLKGDEAVAACDEAIRRNSRDVLSYIYRCMGYFQTGHIDRSIDDCSKAIEIDPKESSAYTNRGAAYHVKYEFARAIADYTKSIEIHPSATRYYNRGLAYEKKGDKDLAIADFRSALGIDPDDKDAEASLKRLGASK